MELSESISNAPSPSKTSLREEARATKLLALRKPKLDDNAFVMSSWLTSFMQQRKVQNANKEFWAYWKAKIEELFSYPATQLWVLCSTENPDHIAGWACFTRVGEHAAIHWVYIKAPYRKLGLLWRLLGAGGIDRHTSVVYTLPCRRARSLSKLFEQSDAYPLEEFLDAD